MGTNSHCDREHSGHGNRNASDKQHQQIVNSITVLALLNGVHHNDLDDDSNGNGDNTEVSDCSQHLDSKSTRG